jgi:AcrR family transcriptional regulator
VKKKKVAVSVGTIVDAAVELLRADRAAGLGFNRVARALGIQPPSLYNHVADGDDLRRLVAIRGWQLFCDVCEAAQGRKRGARALHAFSDAYRRFAREEPGLFDLMETVPLSPSDPDHIVSMQRLLALFDAPLADLQVKPAERTHVIRALRAAVHGFVVLERQGQFAMAVDVDTSFQKMIDRVVGG